MLHNKIARGLKFWIYKIEGLQYLCGKNKGAVLMISCAVTAQLICAFVFGNEKNSHDAAHTISNDVTSNIRIIWRTAKPKR